MRFSFILQLLLNHAFSLRIAPEGHQISAGAFCESVPIELPKGVILGKCFPSGWIIFPEYPQSQTPKPDISSTTEPSPEMVNWSQNAPQFTFCYLTSAELNGKLPRWIIDKFYSSTLIKFFKLVEETILKTGKEADANQPTA